jgi:hypothetical protein
MNNSKNSNCALCEREIENQKGYEVSTIHLPFKLCEYCHLFVNNHTQNTYSSVIYLLLGKLKKIENKIYSENN